MSATCQPQYIFTTRQLQTLFLPRENPLFLSPIFILKIHSQFPKFQLTRFPLEIFIQSVFTRQQKKYIENCTVPKRNMKNCIVMKTLKKPKTQKQKKMKINLFDYARET